MARVKPRRSFADGGFMINHHIAGAATFKVEPTLRADSILSCNEVRHGALQGAALLGISTILLASGCASYRVGSASLYAPDVATVYVPMIESDSFRRDLGERLTEAVIKEIQLKTPFNVVGTPDADSIMSVRLVGDSKRVILESRNDDPRAIEVGRAVVVTWLNRRRDPICMPRTIDLPAELMSIRQTATLIPEAGQSSVTAGQQALERLAQQIVSTMEEPW
jgi:hypothetical protein